MNIKNKLQQILPYWLIVLLLLLVAVLFPYPQKFNPNPQVLGQTTDDPFAVRGQPENSKYSYKKIQEPDTGDVSAQGFLVFDLETGQELMSKGPDEKFYIASLTKLMTGLISYQNLDFNSLYTVATGDRLDVKPGLGLISGDRIKTLDLFNAMLIGSTNDAALALSHYVEDETSVEFPELMNLEAKELGMDSTSFSNPIGFDSKDNFSTAHDLKKLIIATQKLSAFTDLGRRQSYQFKGETGHTYNVKATNQLLKNHDDIQAIKTGYTNGAGGAMATKFVFGNRTIVVLVLDSSYREGDTLKLKDQIEKSFVLE